MTDEFDAESTQRLVAAVVGRIDEFAAALIGRVEATSAAPGAGVASGESASTGGGFVDLLIVEALEALARLLASLISVLETLAVAVDAFLTTRVHATAGAASTDARRARSSFQPITVHIDPGTADGRR